MIRVGIVTNPLDPSTWEEHQTEDLRAKLVELFPSWPASARIFDLEGVGDWTRAATIIDPAVLAARDRTPRDEAGVERLAQLRGPILITIPPADPLTAIIAVVAVAVGLAAAFLFMPKLPGANRAPSPNNALSERTNQARPNQRINDIYGTVEATPDLAAVPYSIFENNREVEISYMIVGRGAYSIARVRDGETSVASVAGASAAIYGPNTSPNSGDPPQLLIGAPITEPVMSVVKLNDVNGQTLQPTNLNFVQGENSIRFVYPDQIQTNDDDIDFTKYFSAGDALTVAQADISGSAGSNTITADARFLASGEVEFATLNPATVFKPGDQLTIANAGNAGDAGAGIPVASRAGRSDGVYVATKGSPVQDGVAFEVLLNEDSAAGPNPTYMILTDDGRTWAFSTGGGPFPSDQLRAGKILRLVPSYGGNVWVITQIRDSGVTYVDLSGTYPILSIAGQKVQLDDPGGVNTDWNKLEGFANDRTEYRSANFSVPTATAGVNLNGNYTALAVEAKAVTLNNPALVNASWNNLDDLPEQATKYVSASLSRNSESWVGPFIVDLDENQEIIANYVGLNGLYTLSKEKGKQRGLTVGVVLEVTPVNVNDAAIGPAELFPGQIVGSDKEKTSVGMTLRASPSFYGRCSVRSRRTTATPRDDDFGGIVDEVKWRDCYGLAPVDQDHFGDITTVQTRTVATTGALTLKNRRLNMRVTRKLPQRVEGSTFGPLVATNSADDIIAAMCLDPYIGRRAPDEVDFDSIYDTIAEVRSYFGDSVAAEFGYTFDDTDVSFEETLQTVAQAVFCTAFRQGRVIRLAFERATEDSSLIFNARNILPDTQKRTVRFGPLDDHDGVELDYTSPTDGAALTYAIPTNRSATSARSIEIVGVRSFQLAYWQAWRAWNKVRFQNMAVELEATQEAALAIPKDRVLIADLTRPHIIQGEVEAVAGTTLRLSDPADLDPAKGWTIFIQHYDETVEALAVTPGPTPYQVILSAAPRAQLSTAAENFARSTYMIVPDDDVQTRAFLITEREPNSNFTETVRAVNYSFLYYQHDQLAVWLPFGEDGPFDQSPWQRGGATSGSGGLVYDADRDRDVYQANGDGGIELTSGIWPRAYTVTAWVRGTGYLVFGGAQGAVVVGDAGVAVAHGSSTANAPWPGSADWHHLAASFDPLDGVCRLYRDGQPIGQQALPAVTSNAFTPLVNWSGKADDFRMYHRALSANEVRSIWLSSRVRAIQ